MSSKILIIFRMFRNMIILDKDAQILHKTTIYLDLEIHEINATTLFKPDNKVLVKSLIQTKFIVRL